MKTRFVFVMLFLYLQPINASAAMSKVIEVRDSRTLVVETAGVSSTVVLRGVTVEAREERAALKHIRSLLFNAWVYVENGEVYRSPDGLFVNGEMKRRAWYGATYMGELEFPPNVSQAGTAVSKSAPKTTKRPSRKTSKTTSKKTQKKTWRKPT